MKQLKCPNCGAFVDFDEEKVAYCEFCGTLVNSPDNAASEYIRHSIRDIDHLLSTGNAELAKYRMQELYQKYPLMPEVQEYFVKFRREYRSAEKRARIINAIYDDGWGRKMVTPKFILTVFDAYDDAIECGCYEEQLREMLSELYTNICSGKQAIRFSSKYLNSSKHQKCENFSIVDFLMNISEMIRLSSEASEEKNDYRENKKQLEAVKRQENLRTTEYMSVVILTLIAVVIMSSHEKIHEGLLVFLSVEVFVIFVMVLNYHNQYSRKKDKLKRNMDIIQDSIDQKVRSIGEHREAMESARPFATKYYNEIFGSGDPFEEGGR